MKMLVVRCPSSGIIAEQHVRTSFSFSTSFQIFKYLRNLHSLIVLQEAPSPLVCVSYQTSIIHFNHWLDVPG